MIHQRGTVILRILAQDAKTGLRTRRSRPSATRRTGVISSHGNALAGDTVSQRTVAGRRVKEHRRATEITDWVQAFYTAQQWAAQTVPAVSA
jgi:hypothetical protein